jgi:hypothetical protein
MASPQDLAAASVLQAVSSGARTSLPNAPLEFKRRHDRNVAPGSSNDPAANSGLELVEILSDGPTLGRWLGPLQPRASCTMSQLCCPRCGTLCAETTDWIVQHTTCAVGGSIETIVTTVGLPVARAGRHGQEPQSTPEKSLAATVPIAARALFEAIVAEHYSELVAYARRGLGEPRVPSCQAAKSRKRQELPTTRFAAEECVARLIERLLETGTYARCATPGEMVRYLMAGLKNRIRHERRDRKVSRNREPGLPVGRDDDEYNATDKQDPSVSGDPEHLPDRATTKTGLEHWYALRLDHERAFAAVAETVFNEPRPWLPSEVALALAEDVVGLSVTAIVRESLHAGLSRSFRSMADRDLRGGIAEVRARLQAELADSRPAKGVPFDTSAARIAFMRRWAVDIMQEYRRALGRRRSFSNRSETDG